MIFKAKLGWTDYYSLYCDELNTLLWSTHNLLHSHIGNNRHSYAGYWRNTSWSRRCRWSHWRYDKKTVIYIIFITKQLKHNWIEIKYEQYGQIIIGIHIVYRSIIILILRFHVGLTTNINLTCSNKQYISLLNIVSLTNLIKKSVVL